MNPLLAKQIQNLQGLIRQLGDGLDRALETNVELKVQRDDIQKELWSAQKKNVTYSRHAEQLAEAQQEISRLQAHRDTLSKRLSVLLMDIKNLRMELRK